MKPRILVLCATARGRAFVERALALLPHAEFTVCSLPEEPWEPPFLESIRQLVEGCGHSFVVCRDVAKADIFSSGEFDLLFAVSWRYMVAESVYGRMRRGAFVFHDSLLPRYRGFSPTVWAIINGERETGGTLLEMVPSFDSGRIVDQMAVSIGPGEYIDSVMRRVTEAYLILLSRNLQSLLDQAAVVKPQDESQATYACKRLPEDNRIAWEQPAQKIFNLIRATSRPYPGAYCFADGRKLTIWSADLPDAAQTYVGIVPGRVLERIPGKGVLVLAGDRSVLIHKVQPEGGEAVTADRVLLKLSTTLT